MGIRLTPMDDVDFQKFVAKSIQEYAFNQVQVGNWRAQDAVSLARQELNMMLPEGLETPNSFLSNIVDGSDQKIGMVWFFLDEERPLKTAILLDLFLFPQFRGKGAETQVFKTLEDGLKLLDVKRVELEVFAHKQDDLKIFMDNSFLQTKILMAKNIGDSI